MTNEVGERTDIQPERQPDALPEHPLAPAPSLWLYGAFVLVSALLVMIAFIIGERDWSALLLNIATEIFGAVIILVLVERRLRTSELQAVRHLPRRLTVATLVTLSLSQRQLYRYAQSFHKTLKPLTMSKVARRDLDLAAEKVKCGIMVLGERGTGKTTWLQLVTLNLVKHYLAEPLREVLPIMLPLLRWSSASNLEQAIFEHLNSFAAVSRTALLRLLKTGKVVLVLDGLDDLPPTRIEDFCRSLHTFRQSYPAVVCTISGLPGLTPPQLPLVDTIELPNLTKEQIRKNSAC